VCLVKPKVESSIPAGSNFSPYSAERAIKGTWGNLGRQKEKEMISIIWIASDGPELVPTTEFNIILTNLIRSLPWKAHPYCLLLRGRPHKSCLYRLTVSRNVLLPSSTSWDKPNHQIAPQVEEKENALGAPTPINTPRSSETGVTQEAKNDPSQLATTWEAMCKQCMGASQALAVLKAA
jgi:hypothetical protein